MAMQQPSDARPTIQDIIPGSRWNDLSPRGRGGTVKVDHLTGGGRVQYVSIGRQQDPSKKYMQAVEDFLATHAPQRPVKAPHPRPSTRPIAPEPRMSNLFDLKTRVICDPEVWSANTDDVVAETAAEEPIGRPSAHGAPPSLSGDQAREIFLLRGTATTQEVATAYRITRTIVGNIWAGRTYAWATASLMAQSKPHAEPVRTKEEAMPKVEVAVQAAATLTSPAPVSDPPVYPVVPRPLEEDDRTLLTELAAAVEVLLEWHGKPLPPFFTLDQVTLRNIVSQARIRASDS